MEGVDKTVGDAISFPRQQGSGRQDLQARTRNGGGGVEGKGESW